MSNHSDGLPTPVDHTTGVFRCAWLVNPGELPRQSIRVAVEDGIIAEIAEVPADERPLIRPVALLPRFVNAHTHLEFSLLNHPLPPPEPFTEWVKSVIRHRMTSSDGTDDAVLMGVNESITTGVACLGEICTSDAGHDALQRAGATTEVSAVSFRELLGFTADRADTQQEIAHRHCENVAAGPIRPGLSPHAPYSVHPELFEFAVALSTSSQIPMAMHLAETRDELQLLDSQSGRFVEFLASMQLWDNSVLKPGTTALRYLEKLAEAPRALAVHCNYLTEREIQFVGCHPSIAVVYCPRTHQWFGHPEHPWSKLKQSGATVILGTDSRASNPDLAIWRELQLVASQTQIPIWELLPMITTQAAEALGFESEPYSIQVGSRLNVVQIQTTAETPESLNQQLLA